ncbi:MAG TPA: DUF262 domain-containing protein [Thermoanaerobaculia bacterium]
MKADSLSVRQLFVQDRRYLVPLFQRPYVWEETGQWQPLWEDIIKVAERRRDGNAAKPHFLGAVVLDQIRTVSSSFDARQIIDGQQRLTTLQILLVALRDLACQLGDSDLERAFERLTRNEDPLNKDPDAVFKVWPTNVDRQHFRAVMTAGSHEAVEGICGSPSEGTQSGLRIPQAYLFFHRAAKVWIEDGGGKKPVEHLTVLLKTLLESLLVVVIDLDESDNAQVIFESLNARGTPLLPADLVKNFLFHTAELGGKNIESLYETYWKPFDLDRKFWRAEVRQGRLRRPRLDTFFQHYLTLKTKDEVLSDHLYTTFKEYAGPRPDAASHLESLRDYSLVYRSFFEQEPGSRERFFFERLELMETTTVVPLLLEIFKQAEKQTSRAELRKILVDLESFLVRRMVCQLTTKNYNRLFLDLLSFLRQRNSFGSEDIRAFLVQQEGESTRWPTDTEFQEAWLTVAAYRALVRRRVRMLLEALNLALYSDKTEQVQINKTLTVEHLLPRSWETHWPLSEQEDESQARNRRSTLLHTIGNLTLLTHSLNPAVSNGPWPKKRTQILKHSALNLNRPLEEYDEWDEDAILKRGRALFRVAKKIWPRPTDNES